MFETDATTVSAHQFTDELAQAFYSESSWNFGFIVEPPAR